MEEIIILMVQFFAEVLAQVLLELPLDLATSRTSEKTENNILSGLAAIAIGGFVGALTLLVFPHSFVKYSWLRCANLLFAPLLSYRISKYLSKNKENVNSVIQARFAFLFTFSLVAIRLAYAQY